MFGIASPQHLYLNQVNCSLQRIYMLGHDLLIL